MSSRKGHTVMDVGADGVAIITIINPPVNSLSFDGILLFIPHLPSSIFFFTCKLS